MESVISSAGCFDKTPRHTSCQKTRHWRAPSPLRRLSVSVHMVSTSSFDDEHARAQFLMVPLHQDTHLCANVASACLQTLPTLSVESSCPYEAYCTATDESCMTEAASPMVLFSTCALVTAMTAPNINLQVHHVHKSKPKSLTLARLLLACM